MCMYIYVYIRFALSVILSRERRQVSRLELTIRVLVPHAQAPIIMITVGVMFCLRLALDPLDVGRMYSQRHFSVAFTAASIAGSPKPLKLCICIV